MCYNMCYRSSCNIFYTVNANKCVTIHTNIVKLAIYTATDTQSTLFSAFHHKFQSPHHRLYLQILCIQATSDKSGKCLKYPEARCRGTVG